MSSNTRSVHIGINYTGTGSELRGCVNDAENLQEYMIASGRVIPDNTCLLAEATGAEIVAAFKKLAEDTYTHNVAHVFISYSGHGTWVYDDSHDERDRRDECLCPADYATHGLLRDDDMHDLLHLFNPQTTITMLMDCCNSGSCMDLPFRYVSRTSEVVEATDKACHPHVVMVSGCRDDQTSADAYDTARNEDTGAMTSSFLDVLAKNPPASRDMFVMVDSMRKLLKARRQGQVPQLSTSFRPSGNPVDFLW
jgi:hypothetical protein